jgi:hypothetical protein
MKYLKTYNESNLAGSKIVAPIRSEIEDILVEFKTNYDIRFVHYETIYSEDNFQLQIIPKGYPDSGDVDPILIDGDILDDLGRVCSFIKNEIDFKYSHSYYFINHNYIILIIKTIFIIIYYYLLHCKHLFFFEYSIYYLKQLS